MWHPWLAILSFTNAAVEEFSHRAASSGISSSLTYPSFIGTFDSFVNRFIFLACFGMSGTTRPDVVESWNAMGVEVRLSGSQAFRGPGVSLDLFDCQSGRIDPARIGHSGLRGHVSANKTKYEQAARWRRESLHRSSLYSSDDVRVLSLKYIEDPKCGPALAKALAARFSEVIVDEGQDCNPADLKLLNWLRSNNIRVTFVCDADQAIYDFRRGDTAKLREYGETYPDDCRLLISGNFRSSPAICVLASTLRRAGNIDIALGPSSIVSHPILVLSYDGPVRPQIGAKYLAEATDRGFLHASTIVLAHSRKIARHAAGNLAAVDAAGTSNVERVAQAIGGFWMPNATPREREASLVALESVLLDLMGRQDGQHPRRAASQLGLNRRTLRRQALAIMTKVARSCGTTDADRTAWIKCLQEQVEALSLAVPENQSVRRFFPAQRTEGWAAHLRPAPDLTLAHATIHEVKGREYDSVCVVFPPTKKTSLLFDAWERDTESEAKRVVYVGITRARAFTTIAVPSEFEGRCVGLLRSRQVPHEIQVIREEVKAATG